MGGEAILPLKYFTLLLERGRDVLLLTHARNREELFSTPGLPSERIYFIEDTALHRALWKLGAALPAGLRDHLVGNALQLHTQGAQRRIARALAREGRIDLIHQPIPVSPAAPSRMHGLGVPVIIGPMNGGMHYPPGYEAMQGRLSRLYMRFGRRAGRIANHLLPGKRHARLLLVANARSREALPVPHPAIAELVENAVDFRIFTPPPPRPLRTKPGLALVFVGRLVKWKAIDVTLDALARARMLAPGIELSLDIIGDGPERAALQGRAGALALGDSVRFHGFLPQTEITGHLRQADALILNSLYECGGAVVLEAMSQALAVIASDWGGPVDYLDDSCGVLVSPTPRQDFAQRLAEAIVARARKPAGTRAMGQAGLAKARAQFDWQQKIDRIEALHAQALRPG